MRYILAVKSTGGWGAGADVVSAPRGAAPPLLAPSCRGTLAGRSVSIGGASGRMPGGRCHAAGLGRRVWVKTLAGYRSCHRGNLWFLTGRLRVGLSRGPARAGGGDSLLCPLTGAGRRRGGTSRLVMLMMRIQSSRLETRTKESNISASQ